MKRLLIVLLTIFIQILGCTPENNANDKTQYFKFSNADKAKLINPKSIGAVIKYKNWANVIRQFVVDYCTDQRSSFGFSSFSSPSGIDYYYDTQKTKVSCLDDGGYISYTVNFQTTPSTSDYSTYPYKFSNPRFSGMIDFSLFNNCTDPYSVSCGVILTENYPSTGSLEIEGKRYNNLKIFHSGSTTTLASPNSTGYDRSVNKIYYSNEYGIIGYDEVDGTQWRRVD